MHLNLIKFKWHETLHRMNLISVFVSFQINHRKCDTIYASFILFGRKLQQIADSNRHWKKSIFWSKATGFFENLNLKRVRHHIMWKRVVKNSRAIWNLWTLALLSLRWRGVLNWSLCSVSLLTKTADTDSSFESWHWSWQDV